MDPSLVSAVLVTRGDVDLRQIRQTIDDAGIDETIVWDNSIRMNVACYGRFAGIAEAEHDWIYVQDDDLIAPIPDLLDAWDGDTGILANKPADEPWRFLGCGALFHRDLILAIDPYVAAYGFDADFFRVADVVFAYSNPYRSVDLGHRNLPWGYHTETNPRMYGVPDHIEVRERARDRTLELAHQLP